VNGGLDLSRPSFFYFEGKTYIHHVIKLNIMLHAQVFKEFISIGVTNRVYKIGRQMNPKYGKDGMHGYDMQDFLESIVSDSLLDQVQMDPESGGFYCYFNLEKDREITRNDIHKLRMWMNAVQGDIMLAYTNFITKSLQDETPEVEFTREAQHVNDMVQIKSLGNLEF